MSLTETFFSKEESHLAGEFLSSGYVIRDVEDRAALDEMRREIVRLAASSIGKPLAKSDEDFLNETHDFVPLDKLNEFRLGLYRELNAKQWFRPTYYRLARGMVHGLVGNELAMQNRINLSIQMPLDRTSLLDIHADVFGGDSPYQVVQWLPLVDVRATKSMFILPRPRSDKVIADMKSFAKGGMSALYAAVKEELVWLEIPYGKVLIFTPNVLHGNVVNEEPTTRWSLNTRFTGLFTPYGTAERTLGSYYVPITPRPVTRVGMEYREPTGFDE
jgi:sporadic carbohydrate cluster 2OG-Fe(II) oxygenase